MPVNNEQNLDFQKLKSELRKQTLARRAKITDEYGIKSANFLKTCFSDLGLKVGQICSGYWPIQNEIDPRPLIEEILHHGYQCSLPVVKGDQLIFREINSFESLVEVGFGTFGPGDSATELMPDFLIIPLVAFDRFGGRIGYGRGYYDAAIARLKATKPIRCVGIAFSDQEVKKVPIESHDQYLDMVYTEQGPVQCSRN